jgi:hypothetical protein
MKYSLIVGLFIVGLAIPAQAQYVDQEMCTSAKLIYSSGFCISPSSPHAMTLGPTEELISIIWFETFSYYSVTIFPGNSSSSGILLSMNLDMNRDVTSFSAGNLAAAENYRSVITRGLNLVDAWEPLSDQRF